MINKLAQLWYKRKTKNLKCIPLFTMVFDYPKYRRDGKKNRCLFYAHPELQNDQFVKERLCEVVDYIRDEYDLDVFAYPFGHEEDDVKKMNNKWGSGNEYE